MVPGAVQALLEAVQATGDHQRGNIILEQVIKALAALLCRQASQISHLGLTDDLQTPGVKIIVKIMELEAGAVDVGDRQPGVFIVAPLVQHLQIKGLHKFCDLQSVFTHRTSLIFPARCLTALNSLSHGNTRLQGKNRPLELSFHYI